MSEYNKGEVMNNFRRNPKDTGSSEVQVALMTARINQLSGHFEKHSHDHHSRQGLLRLINKRRTLLEYLKRKNEPTYQNLIQKLGLRR